MEILSERMLREGQGQGDGEGEGEGGEEVFVVRWRTCEEEDGFCGVFLFEFDDVGRIARHVIEEVERGGDTRGEGRVGRGVLLGLQSGCLRRRGVPVRAEGEEVGWHGGVRGSGGGEVELAEHWKDG